MKLATTAITFLLLPLSNCRTAHNAPASFPQLFYIKPLSQFSIQDVNKGVVPRRQLMQQQKTGRNTVYKNKSRLSAYSTFHTFVPIF